MLFCDGYYLSTLTIKEGRSRAGSVGKHRKEIKMGRKPKYENPEDTILSFFNAISDSYRHPGSGDEVGDVPGRKKQELLAEEFGISRIKVRKILITTGDLRYRETAQIQEMLKSGLKMPAVAEKMRISVSTVNSLLPYSKGWRKTLWF